MSESQATPAASAAPAAASASFQPPLAPLSADTPLIHLALSGFGPATVALPLGATSPRPIVVALHGHAVRPEHACTNWRIASLGYAFVLCPHGLPADAPADAAVTFGSAAQTRREIDAGLQALRARFAPYVDPGPVVLAGYSMGARIGVEIVHEAPHLFPIAAFGEGGYAELDRRIARDFARSGIRVLLLCSTKPCEPTFARVRDVLEHSGVAVQLGASGGSKHMFEGAVADVARDRWPWLVAEDPRWRPAVHAIAR